MSRYRDERDYGRRGMREGEDDRYGADRRDYGMGEIPRGRDYDESYGRRGRTGGGGMGRDYGRDYEGGGFGERFGSRDDYGNQPLGGYGGSYGGGWRGPADERASYEQGQDYSRRSYAGRGRSRSRVRCRDIMTRDVTVATRDTTLNEVARMMREEDTGVIPVVEPTASAGATQTAADEIGRGNGRTRSYGKLVGLITDRDIVVRALAEGKDPATTRAEEVMSSDLHTARPNDRVIEVIRKMGDKQVRRIPVTDEDGNLRGIISMADVALETEEDRELADALEEISSGASFWSKIFG